ncbi:hypothetical protein PQ455_02980 [Sphingomonas naphthae]|uniref:Polymerase nucleotidyl transferase domain-containing protein n=1 Tax=Sphingomonas naphthae TaxID=1813468 RepID=A0ABY7TLW7_9SPHN|nr:nucleotidyltransferase domain-containing protein [Sphingomonas naphthae]WCT74210.1 hypothetical protein PQ455_02980 [Sphingomonas naphthae]
MRLTEQEIAAIKGAAAEAFGPDAVVRLFGSRVDDALRGGDIDLHVEVDDLARARSRQVAFRRQLWRDLDLLDIDVVVMSRGAVPRWIDDAALRSGLVL